MGFFGPSAKQKAYKAHAEGMANQARGQQAFNNLAQSQFGDPNFIQFAGTPAELEAQAAQLSQARAMTGYNMPEVGAMSRELGDTYQAALRGDSDAARYMAAQRNRSMANMAGQLRGKGVAGTAAGAGLNQAQMEADTAIAAEMQRQKSAAANDLRGFLYRNQNVQGGALAKGGEQGLAEQMITAPEERGMSVVCTELKRQNMLPQEIWAADHNFGLMLATNHPDIWEGYHIIAGPIVKQMQKSKVFTKLVAKFAVPWAYHIAGNSNLMGRFVMAVGIPLCRLAYTSKTILSKLSYN